MNERLSHDWWVVWLAVSYPFRKTFKANICGHWTKKTGNITSHGESFTMSMPLSENGAPDYCLDCVAKMSITCAWCANSIHIGDPVTLYVPQESFNIPDYAVQYDEDERALVGCLRWDCASGVDRQGFWIPPGKVFRVRSPIEMLLSGENNGKVLIIDDFSNPNSLGRIV